MLPASHEASRTADQQNHDLDGLSIEGGLGPWRLSSCTDARLQPRGSFWVVVAVIAGQNPSVTLEGGK
jgi:hypothetical protein